MKKILSIDIGIVNLGYVFVEIQNGLTVKACNRIDITQVQHCRVSRCNCTLYHDNCIPDYLDHFIQEHQNLFDEADEILIERQPPVGITNVQDLIFTRFRNKVKLISPNSVHKHFKMTRNDYELRKQQSVTISNEYLKDFFNFESNTRQHDISDAMLMILYYTERETLKEKVKETLKETVKETLKSERLVSMDFEIFRFHAQPLFEQFKFVK
jgi:hypothetical protein